MLDKDLNVKVTDFGLGSI